jgi:WD40 repeat protein
MQGKCDIAGGGCSAIAIDPAGRVLAAVVPSLAADGSSASLSLRQVPLSSLSSAAATAYFMNVNVDDALRAACSGPAAAAATDRYVEAAATLLSSRDATTSARSLKFSPDGAWIGCVLTLSLQDIALSFAALFSSSSGQLKRLFPVSATPNEAGAGAPTLSFSPDCAAVSIACSDRAVRTFACPRDTQEASSTAAGPAADDVLSAMKPVAELGEHTSAVYCCAWHPSSPLLVTGAVETTFWLPQQR